MITPITPRGGIKNYAVNPGDYLVRFDGLPALVAYAEAHGQEGIKRAEGYVNGANYSFASFVNGMSFSQVKAKTLHGDDSYVKRADALIANLETQVQETTRGEWIASPAGAYPIVPEALAGSPMPMREYRPMPGLGPINVYVTVSSSSGTSREKIVQRGIVITALLARLQAIRPVELYLVDLSDTRGHMGNGIIVTRIETKPIDLSVLGFVMSDVAFERYIHHPVAWAASDRPASGLGWPAVGFRREGIAPLLGLQAEDLFFEPAHLELDSIMSDPVGWINAQIRATMGEGR